MTAFGAKKAFDRVNHVNILCDVGVPAHVVRIIMNLYSKISAVVKWDNYYSSFCFFFSGIRHGGGIIASVTIYVLYFTTCISIVTTVRFVIVDFKEMNE